ncbi:hypothetical protein GE21DRAFT_5609 [Neurospora crassa]|uniref:Uncharacterized protein n=1 Tax=Neurospora crassa (strain ATCC 24698 / 74-OR23-1A / CBS 708.71 / DSM 1257 / FGSC 987) TaxID=367110 RepID=Q7S9S5_NEUCR|nr:hypothetical protein NCU06590 [Neurospora crassa OR74A]EAA33096.1 hypothetical protein NCU06590 [Neurospora crassa OR74A]KHE84030.1 hypothetical protein GE21DRAFT_5609 [Neurospora crassa]|eukprot:XP_962332.1 hypothetical protein NCU06590 [Neurospora crassa OR74A]
MVESHQDTDIKMSNTSSSSQGTTGLAIRNRSATQDMAATNTSSSSVAVKDIILHAAANVGTEMRQLVRDLAHSADLIELGLAQLRVNDDEAAKVANAAAILKLEEDADNINYEKDVLLEAQRNQEDWNNSVRREHEKRLDRLEGLLDILVQEHTMPVTEETRVSINKKLNEFEEAHKAKCAAEDAEILSRK